MPDRSLDQMIDRLLEEERFSRRGFVRRTGAAALATSSVGTLLAACGGVEGTKTTTGGVAKAVTGNHPKVAIDELNFSNWPLYVEKQVLKTFDKRFGAKTRYTEEINDNEEFFAKVREALRRGRDVKRDIVVLTDFMAARWIRLGYAEPLDKRNIPNVSNLVENLASPVYDRERSYSLPWQSGMTLIGYNPKKTGRKLTSVNDFFDPKFKGRVSFFSEWRDAAGLVAVGQGVKTADATKDDVLKAIEKLDEENRKGQIRRFTGNDYTTDLAKGNLWVAMAYSGDLIQLQADNPDLEYVIPEEGAMLWTDNMMIPKGAAHPYAAETMMNYVYDPVIAAKIAAYVNYVSPVEGARVELLKTDPEVAENELIFPPEEVRARLHPHPTFDDADERELSEAFQKVIGA